MHSDFLGAEITIEPEVAGFSTVITCGRFLVISGKEGGQANVNVICLSLLGFLIQ